MSKLNKSYFQTLKGKNVAFKEVRSGEDISVQIVEHFPDYKVQVLKSRSFIKDTIKVKFVEHFPNVKIQVVDHFGDFSIYME